MRISSWSCRAVLLALLASTAFAAQAQIHAQPGEYAYSVKVKMFGMSMPAVTFKQCVTQQDIDQGKAYVNNEKQADCSPTDLQWSGADFTVAGHCRNPDRTMSGKGKASENGFELMMDVKVEGDMPMTQRQAISATRVGDCVK
jgi:hypothetical protein